MINKYKYSSCDFSVDASKVYLVLPEFKLYMKNKDKYMSYGLDKSSNYARFKKGRKYNYPDWYYDIKYHNRIQDNWIDEDIEKSTGVIEADSLKEMKEYLFMGVILTELTSD